MLELSPASRQGLDDFCSSLSEQEASSLREIIRRVCADPSGQREPRHNYTRRFKNPQKYVRKLPTAVTVWEFKPPRYRGLFLVDPPHLVFLKIRGAHFTTADRCPWH